VLRVPLCAAIIASAADAGKVATPRATAKPAARAVAGRTLMSRR